MPVVSSSFVDPAKTHTVEEFIDLKYQDDMTYRNLSILDRGSSSLEMVDHCLIDDYLPEFLQYAMPITLSAEEYIRYRYCPDLLSFDLYGSTQLDFVILFINDMIDPKEFDLRTIKLIKASQMQKLLSDVYNANEGYIAQNRFDNNIIN